MTNQQALSRLQQVIETLEALPLDDQWLLIDIVRQRLTQKRRETFVNEIAEARDAYRQGRVRRGTVADLMEDLSE